MDGSPYDCEDTKAFHILVDKPDAKPKVIRISPKARSRDISRDPIGTNYRIEICDKNKLCSPYTRHVTKREETKDAR
jgi:hypothetical protein